MRCKVPVRLSGEEGCGKLCIDASATKGKARLHSKQRHGGCTHLLDSNKTQLPKVDI